MSRPPPAAILRDAALATLRRTGPGNVMSAARALALQEAREVMNGPGPAREAIAHSDSGMAAGLYEHATLQLQIAIIVRLFDQPVRGRGRTDRLSFPVASELLAIPGVLDERIEEARDRPIGEPDDNEAQARRQTRAFNAGLSRLEVEHPDRLAILRRFRDGNIAHELEPIPGDPRPLYGHVSAMVEEALEMARLLQNVANGGVVFWQRDESRRSAQALWATVAAGAQRQWRRPRRRESATRLPGVFRWGPRTS